VRLVDDRYRFRGGQADRVLGEVGRAIGDPPQLPRLEEPGV
jgi:hypothetical protein